MANLGVPIKLLHESLGHIITVELKTGEVSFYPSGWMKLIIDVPRETHGRYVSSLTATGTSWPCSFFLSSNLSYSITSITRLCDDSTSLEYSRGLFKHRIEGDCSHRKGWTCITIGTSLHSRKHGTWSYFHCIISIVSLYWRLDPIHYCPRSTCKCPYVGRLPYPSTYVVEGGTGEHCW